MKYAIIIIVMLLVIFFVLGGINIKERERFLFWVIVPPGYEYIRFRFGMRYERSIMKEGINLFVPGIHSIVSKINVKGQDIDLETREYWLKDQVEGTLVFYIRFKVIDSLMYSFQYENPFDVIKDTIEENIRSVLSSITSVEAAKSLDSVDEKFEQLLPVIDETANNCGVKIFAIRAKDINYPEVVERSMKNKKIAENEADAIITRANAYAEAKMAKLKPYLELAEVMNEKGINPSFYSQILQAANVADAVESGSVDTMIMPNGGNDLASTVISAKKILDRVDKE